MDYFSFNGQSSRSEYWGVLLVLTIVGFILGFVLGFAMIAAESLALFFLLLILVIVAISLWLTIAVIVRRCRDAGINTWWTAATFIPYIGFIPLIVIGCLKTETTTA